MWVAAFGDPGPTMVLTVTRIPRIHGPLCLFFEQLHQRPTRPTLAVEHDVTQKVEAIYSGGVLRPTRNLSLQDQQRVRLTVGTIDEPEGDRTAAVARLKAGIASMRFFSEGPLPSREELHDRD
ncbi:MAG: antitoxin family protein [Vicinamibacterales bacterium]